MTVTTRNMLRRMQEEDCHSSDDTDSTWSSESSRSSSETSDEFLPHYQDNDDDNGGTKSKLPEEIEDAIQESYYEACRRGSLEGVKLVLDSSYLYLIKDDLTPLKLAFNAGHYNIVRYILRRSPELQDFLIQSPDNESFLLELLIRMPNDILKIRRLRHLILCSAHRLFTEIVRYHYNNDNKGILENKTLREELLRYHLNLYIKILSQNRSLLDSYQVSQEIGAQNPELYQLIYQYSKKASRPDTSHNQKESKSSFKYFIFGLQWSAIMVFLYHFCLKANEL